MLKKKKAQDNFATLFTGRYTLVASLYATKRAHKDGKSRRTVLCLATKATKDGKPGENGLNKKAILAVVNKGKDGDVFDIKKQWNLGEIVALEGSVTVATELTIRTTKPTVWITQSASETQEFVAAFTKLYREYERRELQVSGANLSGASGIFDQWDDASTVAGGGGGGGDATKPFKGGLKPSKTMRSIPTEATSGVALPTIAQRTDNEVLQELLDMANHDVPLTELAKFESRLHEEITMLQQANVHALIEGEELIFGVVSSLDDSCGQLEQLDDWLRSHGTALSAMRRDIEAIDKRNKAMETHASNASKLQAALNALQSALSLREVHTKALAAQRWDTSNDVDAALSAAEALSQALSAPVKPAWSEMVAVQQRRSHLQGLCTKFAKNVSEQLQRSILRGDGGAAAAAALLGSLGGSLAKDDEGESEDAQNDLHVTLNRQAGLVKALRLLSPEEHRKFITTYVTVAAPLLLTRVSESVAIASSTGAAKKSGHTTSRDVRESNLLDLPSAHEKRTSPPKARPMLTNALKVGSEVAITEQEFLVRCLAVDESDEASRLMERLFSEWSNTIFRAVESLHRSNIFATVTMMGEIDSMRLDMSEQSAFVGEALSRLYALVMGNLTAFIDEQLATSCKDQHRGHVHPLKQSCVLPVVAKLPVLVEELEAAVLGEHRGAVDAIYPKLTNAVASWIETSADSMAKHRELSLLRNLWYLASYLGRLQVKSLMHFVQQCTTQWRYHMETFCRMIAAKQFGRFLDFVQGLNECMARGMPVDEIQFLEAYSKSEFRKAYRVYSEKPHKAALAMRKRVVKYLADEPELVERVWTALQKFVTSTVESAMPLVEQLYAGESLDVGPQAWGELMADAAVAIPAGSSSGAGGGI